MTIFDRYLFKRDTWVRRRVKIDNLLYEKLEELTEEYETTINRLVNIAIIHMIETENIKVYKRPNAEIAEAHNFAIRETSYKKLEELRSKYGLPIYKLINIAIYNAINERN